MKGPVSPSMAAVPIGIYISPYDDMVQRYASVSGSGSHSGASESNAWTYAESLTNSSVGECVNIAAGNYTAAANQQPNNKGTGPHITQRIVFRPTPGTALHGVEFDLGESNHLVDDFDFWVFDGEESRFSVINGGAWFVSSNAVYSTSKGVQLFNFDGLALAFGGDNNGLIFFGNDFAQTLLTQFENFSISRAGPSGGNAAALWVTQTPDIAIRNFELYTDGGQSLYWKHGPSEGSIASTEWNTIFERGLITAIGSSVNGVFADQSGHSINRNLVVMGHRQHNGGTTNGNFRDFAHCTWIDNHGQGATFSASDSSWPGEWHPTLRYCVAEIFEWFPSSPANALDLDWNAFDSGVRWEDTTYDLAGIRTAQGGDANSVQGTVSFAGSDVQVISDWALTGVGRGTGPTGRDLGANTDIVGVLDAGVWQPEINEEFFLSPLNQRSDDAWYDEVTFPTGTHIRHGYGCYEFDWANGDPASPYAAIRHKFTETNEFTLEFEFWATNGFADGTHCLYVRSTEESDFRSPSSGFNLYLEPEADGTFYVDFRDSDLQWHSYRGADGANLATDSNVDCYDGALHRIKWFCRGNTVGQSNGTLELWVDNHMVIGRTDIEFFTVSGQAFNQFSLGPALLNSPSAQIQSISLANLKLWPRDMI